MLARVLFLGALLAGAVAAQTPEEYRASISAERWMSMCRGVAEAKIQPNGRMQVPNTLEIGQCLGALDAIGILFAQEENGKPLLQICAPPRPTAIQRASVFIDYLKRHPQQNKEPFATVMVAAFREAYPCSSPKKR